MNDTIVSGAADTDTLSRLTQGTVLVVGDIMLDRFVEGAVERISPEAPIPILRVTNERQALGGAGNVARNIASLGGSVRLVTAIGNDPAGRSVLAELAEMETAEVLPVTASDRPTGVKTRYMAATQQLLRADRETVAPLSTTDATAIVTRAKSALDGAGAMILSDYGKGVLAPETLSELITIAREAGVPVLVDPKGRDFSIYRGASLLTPNRQELSLASGMPTDNDQEIAAACATITQNAGVDGLLATRSEQGMTLYRTDAEAPQIDNLPTRARAVYDVVGAGDTVIAAMALGLAAGLDPVASAQIANRAAGIVVGKVGTAVAYPDEILADSHEDAFAGAETKCAPLSEAIDRVAGWRREGHKVGFTNGCFDLLHPGHVSLISQAAAACDKLVLGLNSDESVRRLKGESRPIQSEASRATVLASLEGVDLVVVFGSDTPLELINALKPDLLVKGADYTKDKVVGADEVESWGGQVMLAELVANQSTTSIAKRMNGK